MNERAVLTPSGRFVLLVTPNALAVYAKAWGWRLDAKGRVPRGSQWRCQICGARGHTGNCSPRALARAERGLREFLRGPKA